jgi:hypothetical protein
VICFFREVCDLFRETWSDHLADRFLTEFLWIDEMCHAELLSCRKFRKVQNGLKFREVSGFKHQGLPSSCLSGFISTPIIFDAPQILAPSATCILKTVPSVMPFLELWIAGTAFS